MHLGAPSGGLFDHRFIRGDEDGPSSINIRRMLYRITQIGAIATAMESDPRSGRFISPQATDVATAEFLNDARWSRFLFTRLYLLLAA